MIIDMRPVSIPVVLITSHEVAEQISKTSKMFPLGPPKLPTMVEIVHLTGSKSILRAEVRTNKLLYPMSLPLLTCLYFLGGQVDDAP